MPQAWALPTVVQAGLCYDIGMTIDHDRPMSPENDPWVRTSRPEDPAACLWCGSRAGLVWVHGHGQCATCGLNVDECCRGEVCEPR